MNVGIHELPLASSLPEKRETQRIGIIAPTDSFSIKRDPGIERAHNRYAMYVFGEVHYFDGFMPDRVTQFLYMMRGGENWSWKACLETCQDGNRST